MTIALGLAEGGIISVRLLEITLDIAENVQLAAVLN